MRNVLKAETLERKFPLLSVENGCIVSKDADLTVAFEVELPELFTMTAAEYEAVHSSWVKAVKVLPDFSVVCKQDWFTKEIYRPDFRDGEQSFLSKSYERHFNERPYLNHKCYLYLTKTTRERSRQRSDFNSLCRGSLLPKEMVDKDTALRFLEAVEQFERIMNDSGYVSLRRLEADEITGTEGRPGLVEKYFSLSLEDETAVLQDICLNPGGMRVGDKRLCVHILSDTEDLPGRVSTDMRYERMSTDRSDCRLSFAATDRSFSMIPDKEERLNFILASYNAGLGHIYDAMALAEKYGKNKLVWKDNVENFILLKSNEEYFTDPVCKNGYFRGIETYNFVRDIVSRYESYKKKIKA